MAWVEGLTNSQRILHTITNILTTSNKGLVTRYRKIVNGVAVDYELTENPVGTWKDKDGNTVNIADYTAVQVPGATVDLSKNWQLIYATGGSTDAKQLEINLNSMSIWETFNGFDAKRVILKTTTTPVTVDSSYDEYNTDPDSKVSKIDMFIELVKYRYAINPETNLEETAHPVTGATLKMTNNHYIEVRYGDKIDMPDRGEWEDGAKKYNPYIVTKTDRAEQKGLGLNSDGIICTITQDQATLNYIYTPVEDATLYDIVYQYGSKLIEKDAGGHPSEFSKFSWYVDYKEELYDAMDGGPSSDDISKGIYLMPQILSGMSETIPIQFWINCDNDRVSMVLMGDPTIDFDRYLTSFAYLGKINSFEGDGVVNDTAGNFALTVGSATIPAKKPKPLSEPIKGKVAVEDPSVDGFAASADNVMQYFYASDSGVLGNANTDEWSATKYGLQGWYLPATGTGGAVVNDVAKITAASLMYIKKYRNAYKFIASTADDQTTASNAFEVVYGKRFIDETAAAPAEGKKGTLQYGNVQEAGKEATMVDVINETYTFKLKVPLAAKSVKVYKIADISNDNVVGWPAAYKYDYTQQLYLYDTIDFAASGASVVKVGDDVTGYYEVTWVEDDILSIPDKSNAANVMPIVKPGAERSVIRDDVLNFVLSVTFPNTWGDDTTATGVTDVAMYKTRSGVYNQRHYSSFITPEEYMRKDAFNPSRWTGKFHLSPTYIVHGYDGYRGWLKDTVIVDNTSIVHLDELIVNKDSKDKENPQEIFKYFKLNSPFAFLNNSPNYNYGVGILKSRSYIDANGNRIELYN